MDSTKLSELASQFLPSYLLPESRTKLLGYIDSFPHNKGYYTSLGAPTFLQGDTWTEFVVFNFDDGQRKTVAAMVVSNSCDISPENSTLAEQRVLFSPVIKLQRFVDLLTASGRTAEQIQSTIGRMKKQHINNIFFLPASGEFPDSLVLLDNIHSQPLQYFWNSPANRLLRLSDFGFWLFALKLSIHFTRLQEEVQRGYADSD